MIELRPLKEKDAPYMLEWLRDEDTTRLLSDDLKSLSAGEVESLCANGSIITILKKPVNLHYAIIESTKDEYLGSISLKNIDYRSLNCEYSIIIRRDYRRSGAGKRATDLIIKKAFHELGLHRVYLKVLSDNIRAISFYESYGFKYEGEARDHTLSKDGFLSLKFYSLLSTDLTTPFIYSKRNL